jgi:hypothetical protein
MPTTSNFGWTTPADTDLVKDGAAAIRTLGNGVDASLVDLKGGTTGQVLSKATNTDLDYTWITPNVGDITEVQAGTGISVASGTGPIPVVTNTVATAFDAAGDLVYGTGADTFTKLSLGTANQVLTVNAGATAPEWKTPASGTTFVGAYATKTAAQTLTNNTDTVLSWNAERFDTDGFHDNSTNNSRMTIPSGKGGKYLVVASAYWATGSGYRELNVLKNGSIVNYFYTVIDVNYGFQNISTIVDCVATDYLEVRGFQNSGGNLNVNGGAENSFFSVTYLGA